MLYHDTAVAAATLAMGGNGRCALLRRIFAAEDLSTEETHDALPSCCLLGVSHTCAVRVLARGVIKLGHVHLMYGFWRLRANLSARGQNSSKRSAVQLPSMPCSQPY